jgi:hypothetical protein
MTTTTRKSQPARAAANVQPSVVSDPPVSFSIPAAKVPISMFLLGQMVERGEIPAPITLGRRTRYYSYETFTQVVKAVRAKLEQRS